MAITTLIKFSIFWYKPKYDDPKVALIVLYGLHANVQTHKMGKIWHGNNMPICLHEIKKQSCPTKPKMWYHELILHFLTV